MDSNERFGLLLQRYLNDELSAAEHDEFQALLSTDKYDHLLQQAMEQDFSDKHLLLEADLPPHLAAEIIRHIYDAEKNTAKVLPMPIRRNTRWRWMAAASVLLLAVAGYFFVARERSTTVSDEPALAASTPAGMRVFANNTNSEKTILLDDSSRVTLQPNSRIHYLKGFTTANREVFLEGAAFFKVKRDESKPFLVHYNQIVTRVLGTSFTVRTNKQTGNIEVLVKTGKVQVSENQKLQHEGKPGPVIVTPNQKAVYASGRRTLETSLVDMPQPVIDEEEDPVQTQFVYDQATLGNVLQDLENVYGIETITENSSLLNCVFTGDVTSQDLFTKLRIICLTINATYEINGTRILIKGAGCK